MPQLEIDRPLAGAELFLSTDERPRSLHRFKRFFEAKWLRLFQAEFTYAQRTVGISTTARHEEWINHREKECVGTVINMFLFKCGSVHFYSVAAGLFYLQDRGTLFNSMQFRLTALNIYLRFYA